jgi:hypothetical protein
MSDTSKHGWKTVQPFTSEFEAEIAAFNAELEAKAAAQEAAARQEQKNIIKEAILEALQEYGAAKQEEISFAPVRMLTDSRLNVR